jgi:hypothetical protein
MKTSIAALVLCLVSANAYASDGMGGAAMIGIILAVAGIGRFLWSAKSSRIS